MNLKTSKEQELIFPIVINNIKSYREIHDRYSTKMFLYAYNIIKEKEESEDIVQNIFIDLWTKRNDIEIFNIESYLFRAVKFQIFNYFRNQKFTKADLTRLNLIDFSINASKKMEYDELEKTINSYVEKLPKRCKLIFELSRFQHKTNKEISEELGITMQAVKNQISKALIFIRQNLQNEELILLFALLFTITYR